ncbi:hypothetical protein NAPIS_ORF00423 [Vairimorpha apis BRL 01]|uniref:Uncharacterized protein n=1 Tax=Vairimorpha apis BRL 01 TaxID=1037528 RepID=T0MFZ4_9MICR|nr:hypothetical protein NAPIS_ORF00423 [Vairimorpha apis BRL 01]
MKFIFLLILIENKNPIKNLAFKATIFKNICLNSKFTKNNLRNLTTEIVPESFSGLVYKNIPTQCISLNNNYQEKFYICNYKNNATNGFCQHMVVSSIYEISNNNLTNLSKKPVVVHNPFEMLCRKMLYDCCMIKNYNNASLSILFNKILKELNNTASILNIELNDFYVFVEKKDLILGFIKMEKSINYITPEIQILRLLNSLIDIKQNEVNREIIYEQMLEYVNFITETINLYVHMYENKKKNYVFKIYKFTNLNFFEY